jgi:hypothetical protein
VKWGNSCLQKQQESEGQYMRIGKARFKMTVMTSGWMTLVLLTFTLLIPDSSHAVTFFDTSFETCREGTGSDFPCEGWDDFGQENPGHLEVTNDLAYPGGTKSVKGTFDDVNGSSQQPSISRSFTDSTHVFARFATRASPGFQISVNGHTKMVRFKGDTGYPLVWIMNRWGVYSIVVEGPYDATGSVDVYSSSIAPSQTSWDQVEFEWKLNTPGQSNGHMRLWVNGTLRIERLNNAYIGPTPTSVGPAHGLLNSSNYLIGTAQIYVQSGLGSIYYDRFAVGNTRIGMTTGAPSTDTTPPASPTGLQVR